MAIFDVFFEKHRYRNAVEEVLVPNFPDCILLFESVGSKNINLRLDIKVP